jgi:hypothetical protein
MGQGDRVASWVGSLDHEGLKEATTEGGFGCDQRGVRSDDGQGYDRQNRRPSTLLPGRPGGTPPHDGESGQERSG